MRTFFYCVALAIGYVALSCVSFAQETKQETVIDKTLDGDWSWGPNTMAIVQKGNQITVTCSYRHPKDGRIEWRMMGTISKDRKITGRLIHTNSPKTYVKQTHSGIVSEDCNTITGRAEFDGGGGEDYVWKRGAADPRLRFVGQWELLNDKGGTIFVITLKESGESRTTNGEGGIGKWEVVGGDVRITWGGGWLDIIRAEKDGYRKLAFKPGTTWKDKPHENLRIVKSDVPIEIENENVNEGPPDFTAWKNRPIVESDKFLEGPTDFNAVMNQPFAGIQPINISELPKELQSLADAARGKKGVILVNVVDGGFVQLAGGKQADILVGLNGWQVRSVVDFYAAIRTLEPGKEAEVKLIAVDDNLVYAKNPVTKKAVVPTMREAILSRLLTNEDRVSGDVWVEHPKEDKKLIFIQADKVSLCQIAPYFQVKNGKAVNLRVFLCVLRPGFLLPNAIGIRAGDQYTEFPVRFGDVGSKIGVPNSASWVDWPVDDKLFESLSTLV